MGTLAGHPYLTRAEWGARPPTDPLQAMRPGPTPRLWIHHSADDRQGAEAVRAHQLYHQQTKGWKDIAYNFLVGIEGVIFEGRGPRIIGGATAGDNATSHAICLLGDFTSYGPSPAQWRALVDLVRHGRDAGWWVPTCGGHRDAPAAETACPGHHLYARLGELRRAITLPQEEDPMAIFDDIDDFEAAVARVVDARFTTQGSGVRSGLVDLLAATIAAPSHKLGQAVRAAVRAAVDPKVFAQAVVDELPEGSADVAEIEAAVERVLDRSLRAAADG